VGASSVSIEMFARNVERKDESKKNIHSKCKNT
jgi:hypothetical protein